MTEYTERTIYRWRIDVGLSWHQELAAFDRETENDAWSDWDDWAAHLDLEDLHGQVVITLDSDAGTDPTGLITFEPDGTINFDIDSDVTADLTPTSTVGRGKEKAQLVGTLYATDPETPGEPYPLALIKCVVKEP